MGGWGGLFYERSGDAHCLAYGFKLGVNFRFWSFLGFSGQIAIIFNREGLVYGCI